MPRGEQLKWKSEPLHLSLALLGDGHNDTSEVQMLQAVQLQDAVGSWGLIPVKLKADGGAIHDDEPHDQLRQENRDMGARGGENSLRSDHRDGAFPACTQLVIDSRAPHLLNTHTRTHTLTHSERWAGNEVLEGALCPWRCPSSHERAREAMCDTADDIAA